MEFKEKESTEQFLSGGGEMGKLIRSMDWSNTALGPIESWPQSLRTSVSLCLSSTFPILIAWGPETIQIYNDSYRPICGAKHPESMGQNFRICWETALPVVGDKFDRGQQGEGTYITDQRMFLDRYGYLEESFMTFSFAPIRDESGGVGGIFHPISESTGKMLSARRTQALRDLGAAISKAKSVDEIGKLTQDLYNDYVLDVPFALLYQLEKDKASLISCAGIPADTSLTPLKIDIENDEKWPLKNAITSGEIITVTGLDEIFGAFTCQPYEQPPHTAVILPLRISGQEELFGFMIAGVSACRALDNEYLNFYNLLAATYNTAVSNVYAYEQEQKRAEALAAIDRSKTAFFSNVSHEFRTPLTLMLGPLEDMLSKSSEEFKAPLEATHRNALRLLKLVNNLLDYSRVEAGRTQAVYQLTNLPQLTADLASSFRSIIEKAGMQLTVNCNPIYADTYVDMQMWEKIVLNLLSNAFKYTLSGSITVSLRQLGEKVELKVADTGVGIPKKELPHMFERFHRIENSAGRTHEGTGIGLSLVHELVLLHGGLIAVESIEGVGTTFTVTIPTGKLHLPQEHVSQTQKLNDSSAVKGAFLQEAISLLQNEEDKQLEAVEPSVADATAVNDFEASNGARVLVVDDNADMRAYLARLLEPYFTVTTALNGQDALNKLNNGQLPALVVSDIMMPVMDGKEMLAQIRSNPRMLRLPVIFLSARAGAESRIDGLEAGADDYLVKPFSAAELLTKIRAQINISSVRLHAEQQLRNLFRQAPVAIGIYRGANYMVELANEKMLEYCRLTEQEIVGYSLLNVMPSLAGLGFEKIMTEIYQTGTPFTLNDLPIVVKRNEREETIYINLTMIAIEGDNGIINGIMSVATEVTQQVLASKELEKLNDTLNLAMNASGMGLWKTEWGTNVLEVSPKAREIHGIPMTADLTFDGTLDVVVPEHRDRFHNAILAAVNEKGSFNENYQVQPFDGSKRKWLNSAGLVELNEQGEVKQVIGTILDITESKEDELRKNDFIGMVSHELKTPLTSLNGYIQLLTRYAERDDNIASQNHLKRAQQQINKMSSMINGFLNVSRLESGKIQLQKTTFNMNELVLEMIDEAKLTGDNDFKATLSDLPVLDADKDKVGVVISNLLSNAVKYSAPETEIVVSTAAANGFITLSVKDKGMGIKPHDLKKLFERYYRVEDNQTQYIAGFGIGLYLSDEIIKRHNGKMWAESEVGEGSTFYFSLPY